jgi:Legionella pneumophila major outer membrane protein precursor
MSAFLRRVLATGALAGLFTTATTAIAQNSTALPPLNMPAPLPPIITNETKAILPPSLYLPVNASEPAPSAGGAAPGSAAVSNGIKDLTHSVMPGMPGMGESHGESHGSASHSSGEGGHGEGGHSEAHEEGSGLFGSAEYLLMRARRGAFDYALVDQTKDLVPRGKLESLNYELRSGVRAGLGYRFKDSKWAAGFNYTFLRTSADRTFDAPVNGLIYATLTRPGLTDNVGFAQASASLEYNVFDLEVSRKIHVDEKLNLRLYGGARFATIRQDFDVLYDLRDANLARVMTKSNFDGFGPMMGAEGTLKLYGGFHLYGRTSAALLTGRITNPYRETQNNGQTVLADVSYRTRRVIPSLGAAIAGGWQGHNVSVRVGYEMTHWTNLIDTPRFTNDLAEGKITTRTGDLSLEGLFVQFAVAY